MAALAKGLLVVVEGVDGAGKSTLIPVLAQLCQERGVPCVVSREPTNGPHGQALRASAKSGRLPLEEELELFVRDRQQHVAEVIAPALAAGKVVILDRYYFSTAAYQGARGADPAQILARNEEFAPAPDLLLLLDLDPARGLGRVRARGDEPDAFEKVAELERARQIFLALDRPYLVRVDAHGSAEEVQAQARAALERLLPTL